MANPHHDVCPNYLLPEFEEARLLFTVEGKTDVQAAVENSGISYSDSYPDTRF